MQEKLLISEIICRSVPLESQHQTTEATMARREQKPNLGHSQTSKVIEGQMTKGEKVYVVENYLVEERTASLLAGDVGLAVIFECQADQIRVHVTDQNGIFWEIPTTAVCKVPEGHLSDLYQEPCLACGLWLSLPPEKSRDANAGDVIRPYRPPIRPL